MKIDGIEIDRLNTTFLIKRLKLLSVLILFYLFFGLLFFAVSIPIAAGAAGDDMQVMGFVFVIPSLIFFAVAGIMIWQSQKIQQELSTRTLSEVEKAEVNGKTKKSLIIFISTIVIGAIIIFIGINSDTGSNSHGGSGCTICGKTATHTFQGSKYCKKHYNNAVDWAIDDVFEDD